MDSQGIGRVSEKFSDDLKLLSSALQVFKRAKIYLPIKTVRIASSKCLLSATEQLA